MTKVTDPAILAELNKKVTDPALLAQLNAPEPADVPTYARDTQSVFGPDINIDRVSTKPPWWTRVDQQDLGNRFAYAASQGGALGARMGGPNVPMDAPEGKSQKFVDALGGALPVGLEFAMAAPALAAITPAAAPAAVTAALVRMGMAAKTAKLLAPGILANPALFGGHTAASGGSAKDVAVSAAEGLAFAGLPAIPGLRTIAKSPVGHEAINVSALAALGKIHDPEQSWGESFGQAVPTALGLKLGTLAAGPVATFKAEGRAEAAREKEIKKEIARQEAEATARRFAERESLAALREDVVAQEAARRSEIEAMHQPVEPQVVPQRGVDLINAGPRSAESLRQAGRRRAADDLPPEATSDIQGLPGRLQPSDAELGIRWRRGAADERAPEMIMPEQGPVDAIRDARGRPILPPDAPRAGRSERPTLIEGPQVDVVQEPTPATVEGPNSLIDKLGWPSAGEATEAPRRSTVIVDPKAPRGPSSVVTPRLGMGLGGGGEAFKFKELREVISGAARRIGSSLPKGDMDIAARVAPYFKEGMKDNEFFAIPGVKEELLKSRDLDEVMRVVQEAANTKPVDPSARGRSPLPAKRASDTLGELQEAATQPRKGKLSQGLNPFLQGETDLPGLAENLRSSGAVRNPVRIKEIRKEIEADIAAQKAEAEAAGVKFNRREALGSRTTKEEATYRHLAEIDPEMDAALRELRAIEDAGGKTNIGKQRTASAATKAQEYVYQAWGDGKPGDANPFDGPLVRATHDSRAVTYATDKTWQTDLRNSLEKNKVKTNTPEASAVGQLIELRGDMTVEQFAATAEGVEIMRGVKNPQGVFNAANDVIAQLHSVRTERNSVTDVHGEKPISERPNFFPKYSKSLGWNQLIAKGKRAYAGPDRVPDSAPSLNAPGKAKKSDPHAKRRTDREIDRDWDVVRVMSRYLSEEAGVVGGTIGLHQAYDRADLMEYHGFNKAADIVRNYAQSDFNRHGWGPLNGLERAFTEGGPANVIGDVAKWNYDRLADAVFTLNLGWNLVVQPSSAVFVAASGSTKEAASGIIGSRSKEHRDFVDKYVFSRQIKSRRGGSVGDVGTDRDLSQIGDTGITKFRHKAQGVNEFIEKEIDYYAAYVGIEHGKRLGLQGRELIDFSSDYIKKTQDVYNRQDRAQLLRGKMFNVLFPFMGFSFNMKAHLQEQGMFSGASKSGTYQVRATRGAKAQYAAKFGLMAAAANAFAAAVAGREDLYSPSSLPMLDIITGGGVSKGRIGPATALQNEYKMWNDAADGKYGEAISRGLRTRVPAGRVLSNLIMADKYTKPGGPFQLKEDEVMWAVVFGVWATPSGKAYLEKIDRPGLLDKLMDAGEEDKSAPANRYDSMRGARPREAQQRQQAHRREAGR